MPSDIIYKPIYGYVHCIVTGTVVSTAVKSDTTRETAGQLGSRFLVPNVKPI